MMLHCVVSDLRSVSVMTPSYAQSIATRSDTGAAAASAASASAGETALGATCRLRTATTASAAPKLGGVCTRA